MKKYHAVSFWRIDLNQRLKKKKKKKATSREGKSSDGEINFSH